MGRCGTGISSNDTYADVYDSFFDLYNDKISIKEITERLIIENQETINEPDDASNFWFALAKAQWECGQLNDEVFDKVKSIIENSEDINAWKNLEATESDIKKRQIVLNKFLETISQPKDKPRKVQKKIIYQPDFSTGDCLTFKYPNGNYGGAIVIGETSDNKFAMNEIILTTLNQANEPNIKDFKKSKIILTIENSRYNHSTKQTESWVSNIYYMYFSKQTSSQKDENVLLNKVGSIQIPNVRAKYFFKRFNDLEIAGSGLNFYIPENFQFLQNHLEQKETQKVVVKDFINDGFLSKLKFWK